MDRDAALIEFNRQADFENLARQHLEAILKQAPTAIMFVVEFGGGEVKMTSVPFSFYLIKGLAEQAHQLTLESDEDVGDDDSLAE